jgi:TFIIF-interacting CTD phosphatase-like protein
METTSLTWSNPEEAGSIRKWQISKNKEISKNQAIAVCVINKKAQTLYSNAEGRVERIHVQEGESFIAGQALVSIVKCSHPCQVAGMCVLCKLDVRDLNLASAVVVPSNPHITLSHDAISEAEATLIASLRAEQKLYLILDIDQTILHTIPSIRLSEADMEFYDIVPINVDDQYHYVKLRPGLGPWLVEVAKMFKIHIYTNGSRNYAKAVVNMVQKKFGKAALFGDEEQRILTRCDTFPSDNQTFSGKKKQTPFLHKSLASIFPNLDQFAVILDDREDIWSTSVENVVRIFPYHFFAFGDINDPAKIAREENKKKRKRNSDPNREKSKNKIPKFENMTEFTKPKEAKEESNNLNGSLSDDKDEDLINMSQVIPNNNNMLESDHNLEWNPFRENDNDELNDENNDGEGNIGFGFGGNKSVSQLFGQNDDEVDKFMETDFNNNFGIHQENQDTKALEDNEEKNWAENNDVNNEEEELNWGDNKEIANNKEQEEYESEKESKEENVEINEIAPQIIMDGTESILKADDDDHLSSILDVLKDIHYDYFKALKTVVSEDLSTVNVKDVIDKRRKRTLKGCNLVMYEVSKKELTICTFFGATLYRDINQNVTHIITNNPSLPAIINRKAEDRVFVVNPMWLWDSTFKWERQDELKYPVEGVDVVLGEAPFIQSEIAIDDHEGSENSNMDKKSESMEYSDEEEEDGDEVANNESSDDGLMGDLEKELQQLKDESSSETSEEDEGEQLRNRFFALEQIEEEDFS